MAPFANGLPGRGVKRWITGRRGDLNCTDSAIGAHFNIEQDGALPAAASGNEGVVRFRVIDELRQLVAGDPPCCTLPWTVAV